MTIKFGLITFLLFLLTQLLCGQNEMIRISGVVVDSTNNTPLSETHIIMQSKKAGTISNSEGRFTLVTNKLPKTLTFSRIGYQTKRLPFFQYTPYTSLTIRMVPDTIMLEETVITGRQNIYNRKTNNYTLLDYTLIDGNIFILQNKLGIKNKKSLVLLNNNFDTLAIRTTIPKTSRFFFNDCLGNTHLLTHDSAYQIWISRKQIKFLKPVNLTWFYSVLKNCQLEKDSCLFYKKSMMADLGEEIYVYSSKQKQPKLFIKSYDKEKYKRYINDVLHISGMYPGHNIPIASVENDSLLMHNIHKYEIESRFLREIVYKPVYNKLFAIHDTIIYFNHINGSIDYYSTELKLTKTIPITYQKSRKWKNILLKDDVTDKIYTFYQDAGYYIIYEVNYYNGTINEVNRIPMFETYKIRVNNNYLYYLRKANMLGSSTVKKLYRDKIGNVSYN